MAVSASESGSAVGILGSPIRQLAFVVPDLETAVHQWADSLDVGPWSAYTMSPPRLTEMTYHGEPCVFSFLNAFAMTGTVQIELIQPLTGPSVFAEHLERFGESVHHVGIVVPDHAASAALLASRGFTPLQSGAGFGADGSGRFAYFAPPAGLGTIVELIEPPKVRAQPLYVYPRRGD